MKKALLIIDVQVSAVTKPDLTAKIEDLQQKYDTVFVSIFKQKQSFLPRILAENWVGYDDETLAFKPKEGAVVFEKGTYSSFLPEMKNFDEIHLCGFDTDACVYKTALDLIEANVRPIVLKDYCFSENETYHQAGLKLLERNIGKQNIK